MTSKISVPTTLYKYVETYCDHKQKNIFLMDSVYHGKFETNYSKTIINEIVYEDMSWEKINTYNFLYGYNINRDSILFCLESKDLSVICKPAIQLYSFKLEILLKKKEKIEIDNKVWRKQVVNAKKFEVFHSLFALCHEYNEISKNRYRHSGLSLFCSDRFFIPYQITTANDLRYVLENLYTKSQKIVSKQGLVVLKCLQNGQPVSIIQKLYKSSFKPTMLIITNDCKYRKHDYNPITEFQYRYSSEDIAKSESFDF